MVLRLSGRSLNWSVQPIDVEGMTDERRCFEDPSDRGAGEEGKMLESFYTPSAHVLQPCGAMALISRL